MILYSDENDKIVCYKCKEPKMKDFDHLSACIRSEEESKKVLMHFSVRNNASYYYFRFKNQWYMTNMVQDNGLDLFSYLFNQGREIFTYKQNKGE